MRTRYLTTAGLALALGVAWTAAPALAQQTTGEKVDQSMERTKDKAERTKDKAEDKAERAKDKAEDKAERTKDKAEHKAERAKAKAENTTDRASDKAESKTEQAKDKARELKDKTKEKTTELKDEVKDKTASLTHKSHAKTDRADARMHAGMHDRTDVMAMQRSLQDKGYDPGPIDGVMGPRTHAALMDYQKKEGLTPTGRWDDETRARLGMNMSSAPDQTAVSASPADPRGTRPTVDNPPPTKRQSP